MVSPFCRNRSATRSARSLDGNVVITSCTRFSSSQTQINSGRVTPTASTSASNCSRLVSLSSYGASSNGSPHANTHQPYPERPGAVPVPARRTAAVNRRIAASTRPVSLISRIRYPFQRAFSAYSPVVCHHCSNDSVTRTTQKQPPPNARHKSRPHDTFLAPIGMDRWDTIPSAVSRLAGGPTDDKPQTKLVPRRKSV